MLSDGDIIPNLCLSAVSPPRALGLLRFHFLCGNFIFSAPTGAESNIASPEDQKMMAQTTCLVPDNYCCFSLYNGSENVPPHIFMSGLTVPLDAEC